MFVKINANNKYICSTEINYSYLNIKYLLNNILIVKHISGQRNTGLIKSLQKGGTEMAKK